MLSGSDCARIACRAIDLLPEGHGQVSFRVDSGFYRVELLRRLRERGATFTVSVPCSSAMWAALGRIAEEGWKPATEMAGAEVAETTYSPKEWKGEPLRLIMRRVALRAADVSPHTRSRRRRTIHPDQLALLEAGEDAGRLYGYSFILTDREEDAAWIEHHHPHRAQIEERIPRGEAGRRPAPDALRRSGRQPRLAVLLPARAQPRRDGLRRLAAGRRLGGGARRIAASPRCKDPAAAALRGAGAGDPHRQADDPAPAGGLSPRRRLRRHLQGGLGASASLSARISHRTRSENTVRGARCPETDLSGPAAPPIAPPPTPDRSGELFAHSIAAEIQRKTAYSRI